MQTFGYKNLIFNEIFLVGDMRSVAVDDECYGYQFIYYKYAKMSIIVGICPFVSVSISNQSLVQYLARQGQSGGINKEVNNLTVIQ